MIETMKRCIRAARGEMPPDLVVKNGRVINVFSREILEADIAVQDGLIAGVGSYDGHNIIDAKGRYVCPGFIEGHFHIESTMLAPPELAKAVIPYGTTSIIADPHEIANVLGMRGIQFMLDASRNLAVDFFFMLPSCVPATHLETAGAVLEVQDLAGLKNEDRVLGLAEMMNYPGVIFGMESVLNKLAAFDDRIKDGHCPLLAGKDLNAYVGAGISSDHECTRLAEAMEKLRLGMHIFIREGTQAKNLKTLLPMVSAATLPNCSLVTDDLHPHDLLKYGHLNHLIDRAVEEGLDPVQAIMMVTVNTARHFGLKDRGAIAPGYKADLLILSSLQPVVVDQVIKNGNVVFPGNTLSGNTAVLSSVENVSPMTVKPYQPDSFAIDQAGEEVRVIGLIPDQILTEQRILRATVQQGRVIPDIKRDILKIAVVERHHGTGNIGLGLVQGFGLCQGAIASSVAHDSHNIVCVGCSDGDIFAAVREVEKIKGGLVAVKDGQVLASESLPIGGLMSSRSLKETAAGWERIRDIAGALGCTLREPLMALSFMALPVIPELKITDKGLVDVAAFKHVPLFVS